MTNNKEHLGGYEPNGGRESLGPAAPPQLSHAVPTPGPWMMPGVFNMSDTYCTTITADDRRVKVCTLTFNEDRDQSQANAHLIAAAPELLAEVKALLDFIHARNRTTWTATDTRRVEAVITKAEGRNG